MEGKNHLLSVAAELVSLQLDGIVTGGPQPTRAAKQATSTIPIVMANDPDPVASGTVAILARADKGYPIPGSRVEKAKCN